MSKITGYFESYPLSNKCFETTDGQLFHEEGDANMHQGTVDKKGKVKAHFSSDYVAKAQNADAAASSAVVNSQKQKAGKTVKDEVKKEGEQPDVVNEILEAGLQEAVVATVDGEATSDAANDADLEVKEVPTGTTETVAVAAEKPAKPKTKRAPRKRGS